MSTVPEDVLSAVRDALARDGGRVTPQDVGRALRQGGRPVGDVEVLEVHDRLRRDVVGAGPLDDLLNLPGVTDVLVNGPDAVYVDRGGGLELTTTTFPDDGAVRRLAQRLAAAGGRRLDDACPHVDVRLPDGTRCHALLAPLARPGTTISLRVPAARALGLEDLERHGSVSPQGRELLEHLVKARAAFLVSGGTGSGKTTLLGALLSHVPPEDRVVVVEDTAELRVSHPHVVALEGRPPNAEGAGEITVRTLVRQALRMRPDRLVVGEVRGAEVVDLLAAMNTGHEGGCGTVHANSAADVPARIESLALAAGLGREAARSQLASAVDVVLHLTRARGLPRRLQQVGVVVTQSVRVDPAVTFDPDLRPSVGPGWDALQRILEGGR